MVERIIPKVCCSAQILSKYGIFRPIKRDIFYYKLLRRTQLLSYWNQEETEQKDIVEELEEFNMLKKLLVTYDKTAQSYVESTVYYSMYSRSKMQ